MEGWVRELAAIALLSAALLPLARGGTPRDGHAVVAALAVVLGATAEWGFVAVAVVPALLFDPRRLGIHACLCLLGVAAVNGPAGPPVGHAWLLAVVMLPGLAFLAGYVRLRRRGLMERDRHARLLAGVTAAQALVAALGRGERILPALLLASVAALALWPMCGRAFLRYCKMAGTR